MNAAHYKTLLAAAEVANVERELLDARQKHQLAAQQRLVVLQGVSGTMGHRIKSWDTETGEVEYESLPPAPPRAEPQSSATPDAQ
jgi:hypothetical protein